MKKTVISTIVLAAISSTSAFAANQWGFDITDAASGNSMTVRGTPGDVYDMDKLQNGVDANKQAADDAAKKADDAQNTADRNTGLIGNNATTAGRNASDILALQRSAVISNGQATQLRQDLDTTVQKQNVINQNQITKNQSQDSKIQTLTTSVQTLTTQAGNFASKSDLQKETDERTKADADLQTNIDEKVDQTTYDAGQAKQDAAITKAQDSADKAQQTADKTAKDLIYVKSNADDAYKQSNINKAQIAKDEVKIDANTASITTLKTQVNNAASQITDNKKAIAAETTRATGAEKTNADAITAETTRATGAEKANADAITAETTRATGVEATKVDTTTYDADQKAQDTKITKAQDGADTALAGVQANKQSLVKLTGDVSANTAGVAANKSALTNKVEQSVFTADQKRQDDALMTEATRAGIAETANKDSITKEEQRATGVEATKADQTTVDALRTTVTANTTTSSTNTTSISKNSADIAGNTTNITNNTTNITNNRTDITALEQSQTTQNARFTADETTETNHFKTLQAGVKQAQDTGTYAQARADQAFANADANRQALNHTNQRVADNSKQLANHEQRIQDLESNNQTNFNKLDKQQTKDRNEFRAGLAGAFALTSIPAAPTDHTVGIGMGAGTFNGENAIAAGVSSRMSSNVSVKTGLSWDTQGNVGAGAGFLVSY